MIQGARVVHLSQSVAQEGAANANAGGTGSGESAATISESILRFADQSSKGPAVVHAVSFDGHASQIHPRQECIEGFHFL